MTQFAETFRRLRLTKQPNKLKVVWYRLSGIDLCKRSLIVVYNGCRRGNFFLPIQRVGDSSKIADKSPVVELCAGFRSAIFYASCLLGNNCNMQSAGSLFSCRCFAVQRQKWSPGLRLRRVDEIYTSVPCSRWNSTATVYLFIYLRLNQNKQPKRGKIATTSEASIAMYILECSWADASWNFSKTLSTA